YQGRDSGSFVLSVMACNLRRIRLLVGTWHGSLTHELVVLSGLVGLNILGPHHADLVEVFGKQTSRRINKFEHVEWSRGTTGVPLLTAALGHVEGRVLNAME